MRFRPLCIDYYSEACHQLSEEQDHIHEHAFLLPHSIAFNDGGNHGITTQDQMQTSTEGTTTTLSSIESDLPLKRQNDATTPKEDAVDKDTIAIAERPIHNKLSKSKDGLQNDRTRVSFFGPTVFREECVRRQIDTNGIMKDYHDMTTKETHKLGGIEGLINLSIEALWQSCKEPPSSTANPHTMTARLVDPNEDSTTNSVFSKIHGNDYSTASCSARSQPDMEHLWKEQIRESALLDRSPYIRHPPEQLFDEEDLFGPPSNNPANATSTQCFGRKYVELYFGKHSKRNTVFSKHLGDKGNSDNEHITKTNYFFAEQQPNCTMANDYLCMDHKNFDNLLTNVLEVFDIPKSSFRPDSLAGMNGMVCRDSSKSEQVVLHFSERSDLDTIISPTTRSRMYMCLDPPLPVPLQADEERNSAIASSETQPSLTKLVLQQFGIPSLSKQDSNAQHNGNNNKQTRVLHMAHQNLDTMPIPAIESIISNETTISKRDLEYGTHLGNCCTFTKAPLSVTEHQFQRIPHNSISKVEWNHYPDMLAEIGYERLDHLPTTPLPVRSSLLDVTGKRFEQIRLSKELGLDNDDTYQEHYLRTGRRIATMKTIGQMLSFPTALYLPHTSSSREQRIRKHSEILCAKSVKDSHSHRTPLPKALTVRIRELFASQTKKSKFVSLRGKSYPVGSWVQADKSCSEDDIWSHHAVETNMLCSSDLHDSSHEIAMVFCQNARLKASYQTSQAALLTGCVMKRTKGGCAYKGFISGEIVDADIYEQRYMRTIRSSSQSETRQTVIDYCESILTAATKEQFSSQQFLWSTKKSHTERGEIQRKRRRKRKSISSLSLNSNQPIMSFFEECVPFVHKNRTRSKQSKQNLDLACLFECNEAGKIRREFVYLENKATQMLSQARRASSGQTDHDDDDCSWIQLSRTPRAEEPHLTGTPANNSKSNAGDEYDNTAAAASSPQVFDMPTDIRKKGKRHVGTDTSLRKKKKKKRKKDKKKNRRKPRSKRRSSDGTSAENKRSKHVSSPCEESAGEVPVRRSEGIENIAPSVQAGAEWLGITQVIKQQGTCAIENVDLTIKQVTATRETIQSKKPLINRQTFSSEYQSSTRDVVNKVVAVAHAVEPTPILDKKQRENTFAVPEANTYAPQIHEDRSLHLNEMLLDSTEQENGLKHRTPDQNIGKCSNLSSVKILCSESFLESNGNAITELASGEWTASFAANSAEELSAENILLNFQQKIQGRRILLVDSPLLDDTGVDIELTGGASIIVLRLSSFCIRTATKNVLKLAAIGRYTHLFVLLCCDAAITSSICRDMSILQNAIISLKGSMRTKVLYNTVSPASLSASLAHRILDSVVPEQILMQKIIESSMLDSRILERVRFLISLCPMMSVSAALWLLSVGDHDQMEDTSKEPFQNLLGNKTVHEDFGVSMGLIHQISYTTNVCLTKENPSV